MRFKIAVFVLFLASVSEAQIVAVTPPGAAKTVLTGATDFYVRTDGNDSNSGLANTAGGAWLTLQGAWDNLRAGYNLGGYLATVNVADGTYGPVTLIGDIDGSSPVAATGSYVYWLGNIGTPANVVITASDGGINVFGQAIAYFEGFTISGASSSDCVQSSAGSYLYLYTSAINCSGTNAGIGAYGGSSIECSGCTTTGGEKYFGYVASAGAIFAINTVFSGTPAFTQVYRAIYNSLIWVDGHTGSATGSKFDISDGSYISVVNGTTLPGNSAGTIDYGGVSAIVGEVPTVSSCGAAPSVVVGSDNSGRLTVGGGGAVTSCTLTFANPTTTAPFCSVVNETTSQLMTIVPTATTAVITGVDFQSDVVSFMCKH